MIVHCALCIIQMAHGFYDGDNGNNGFRRAGRLIAVANHLDAGKRTHTIMHTYHALCIIRNQRKTILHRVESRFSTISQHIIHFEMILFAELSPIILLGFWQYEDNLQILSIFAEPFECAHQDRLPTDR